MNSAHSTPSVDFQFLDAPDSLPESPPPLEQSELNYDLSATNSKKNAEFESTSIAPQISTKQLVTIRNSFLCDQLNEEEFFNDFEAHFTVTLNSSSSSLASNQEYKKTKRLKKMATVQTEKENDSCIFNRVSLPHRVDPLKSNFPILPSCDSNQIQTRPNIRKNGGHPIYCFKKKQQSRKQRQVLQHAQSQRATKKDVELDNTQLPVLEPPHTCKHFKADFSVTLKGNTRKNDPSSRYCDNFKKKKNFSVKTGDLKRSIEPSEMSLTLEGRNKPVNVSKQMKKSNIFMKLPTLS